MDVKTIAVIVGVMMLGDVLTGIGGALSQGEKLESTKLREGLWHKSGFAALMFFCWGIDFAAPVIGVEMGDVLYNVASAYIFATEAVSIFENISKMNPEIRNSGIGDFLNWSDNDDADND